MSAPALPHGYRPQDHTSRNNLLRLIAAVVTLIAIAIVFHGLNVLIVIVALIAMVMIHEGGHFATAKWSGMKVTEYFLGFGPRLWSTRRGETEYGVKAVPAGGYVRIVGMTMLEEVAPEDEARSYRQATFPRRLLVAVAGSATHFIVAFILCWVMVSFSGMPTDAPTGVISGFTSFVGHANPAVTAGMRSGDVLVGIDGRRPQSVDGFVSVIENNADRPISLTVRRAGRLVHLTVTPLDGRGVRLTTPVDGESVAKPTSDPHPEGVIGVELSSTTYETTNAFNGLGRGATLLGSVTKATGVGIAQIFSLHGLDDFAHQVTSAANHTSNSGAGSSGSGSGQLISLPGAVEIGAQALSQHVSELLYILVAINIFVGMVNLFPMLPLDGGHVAIAVYERIRTRRGRPYHADVAKLMPVAYLFLAFMVVIGLGALYANIVNPVSLGGS
jgi:membrane-associated protease RseP (regulator of RpoE activity)